MINKIKNIILLTLILISTIMPIKIYLTAYNIDESNLDYELGKYMKSSSLRVIEKGPLDDFEDKYLVVYSEIGSSSVVSLLSKGFNNKYQIRHSYQTHEEISYINYEIELEPFNIIYGSSNNDSTSKLVFTKSGYSVSKQPNNKDVFVIGRGLLRHNSVEIVYDHGTNELPKPSTKINGITHELSISKIQILILFLGFLVFIFGFTLIISSGGEQNVFESDIAIDGDNRLKQMKP